MLNSDRLIMVPDQYKQVTLASGGVLVVAFKGNLLTLSERDLQFVLSMVKQLESYRSVDSQQPEVVNGGDDGEQ